MRSLRARLVLGLLALAAAGLLTLATITYVEQRSFLFERADGQTRSALGVMGRALDDEARGSGRVGEARPPGGPFAGEPGVGLPPGTFGQRRDAAGNVLGEVVVSYGRRVNSRPALPARLPTGRLLTVPARGGGGTRYRALAEPSPFGVGLTVVAVPLSEVDQTLRRLLVVEGVVIAGVLLALAVLSRAVVRVGLLPLDRMGATASAIAAGDLSRRVASTDPRTEVGRLGIALNAMLDRLERAFAARRASENRLRRFLADASHELRTPLASIHGYAELFRLGVASDPGDVEKAMRRMEEEAARMGVLVEGLLTLARLDSVRDAPHAEVDLAALAADAVDDARATAPERDLEARLERRAIVSGDSHGLRQLLGNLLRNALVHTPEGTPIELTVASAGDRVRLEVRDHGPGLPTDDPDELFERFWRSEGGRRRGKGAGLGLAIVAGVVAAHDGRVQARNAPGGGASFLVDLPGAAPSTEGRDAEARDAKAPEPAASSGASSRGQPPGGGTSA